MLSGDSAAWSLKNLLLRGLQSEDQRIYCRPTKHLMSACNQLVNFLGIMQNEWAGAQGIPSFDTYLAPFIKNSLGLTIAFFYHSARLGCARGFKR